MRSIAVTMIFDPAQVRDTYVLRTLKETTELAAGRKPLSTQFHLVRPPLVLVHGINSGSNLWENMRDTIRAEIPDVFILASVDYSNRNNSGFDTIYRAIHGTISSTLTSLRNGTLQEDQFNSTRLLGFQRIAATRLDLLAHSMGGNATRYYIGQTPEFRRTDNYFFGDLRRIITVGTPYKGAAIAAYVWQYPNGEPRIESDLVRVGARRAGQGDLLAYRDLTPASEALRRFETIREADPVRLRGPGVHTIIAYADGASASLETLLWGLYPLGARLLEPYLSDRIVCVQSQRGATLDSGASSELHGLTHTQEAGSTDLFLRVLELLNQAEGAFRFDTSGMPPSRAVPDVPRDFTCGQP